MTMTTANAVALNLAKELDQAGINASVGVSEGDGDSLYIYLHKRPWPSKISPLEKIQERYHAKIVFVGNIKATTQTSSEGEGQFLTPHSTITLTAHAAAMESEANRAHDLIQKLRDVLTSTLAFIPTNDPRRKEIMTLLERTEY
jgi:arabinogalactan endo-1,4-beta-galactosidase